MGKLNDKLLEKVSSERDQYFLDLYDRAEKAAIESSLAKEYAGKDKPIVGAEDIGEELKRLLAEDLSAEDFDEETNRILYHYADYIHLTLSRDKLSDNASEQELEDFSRYQSKFAAIQQTLITYTLGENDQADAKIALSRWHQSPKGQVEQLIAFCEHYKSDLKIIIHKIEEYVFLKFGNTKKTIDVPTLKEARAKLVAVTLLLEYLVTPGLDYDHKIKIFKDMYEHSAIYKPLERVEISLPVIYANTVSTIFRKNIQTGVQHLKMQISERENIAGIDNIVLSKNPEYRTKY